MYVSILFFFILNIYTKPKVLRYFLFQFWYLFFDERHCIFIDLTKLNIWFQLSCYLALQIIKVLIDSLLIKWWVNKECPNDICMIFHVLCTNRSDNRVGLQRFCTWLSSFTIFKGEEIDVTKKTPKYKNIFNFGKNSVTLNQTFHLTAQLEDMPSQY